MKRLLKVLSFLWVFAASVAPASAYVRTLTCNAGADPARDPAACEAGQAPVPIAWPVGCVVAHINNQQLFPDGVSSEDAIEAMRESFAEWNEPACSYVELLDGGFTNEDRVGYDACEASRNANVVMVRSDTWAHASAALALTTVTYDREGVIVDADMEINAVTPTFTTTDEQDDVMIDLQSVVTHEAGHMLGLDHTPDSEATMFASTQEGELHKRDLASDDIAGLCAIYPTNEGDGLLCESSAVGYFNKPEGPFATTCPAQGSCALTGAALCGCGCRGVPVPGSSTGAGGLIAILLAGLAARSVGRMHRGES